MHEFKHTPRPKQGHPSHTYHSAASVERHHHHHHFFQDILTAGKVIAGGVGVVHTIESIMHLREKYEDLPTYGVSYGGRP